MAHRHYILGVLAAVTGAALLFARPAEAQSSGDGFLFSQPVASLVLRGGFHHATAGGDVIDFATEQLTLGRGDFGAAMLGGDLSIRLRPRLDLTLGASYSGMSVASEFRDLVEETENGDLPIEQTTRFQRVPVTAGVKGYLTPRGRSIGNFAWVPARYAPYVGAGAGAMWYRFNQQGDFVDYRTLDPAAGTYEIFTSELETSGWAPTAHAMTGIDVSLTPRLGLTGEARYTWARTRPADGFADFNTMDLSGFAASLGLQLRL
jgi:hypothetical protein